MISKGCTKGIHGSVVSGRVLDSRSACSPHSPSRLVTVDLDGTVANITQRRENALSFGPDKSHAFYTALLDGTKYHMDEPIVAAREFLVRYESELGGKIVYLSGRRKGSEHQSEAWLREHGFPTGRILHRRTGHRSLDFKTEWLMSLKTNSRIDAHFGDRLEDDGGAAKCAGVRFVHIDNDIWPSFDSVFTDSLAFQTW